MEETPDGTPVGVDDPYDHAGVCDHLTDDGRCRFALDRAGDDPAFAREREAAGYECLVADENADWSDCPHYRSTTTERACVRCGLEEVRMATEPARPLVEEHHLSYGDGNTTGETVTHEITVALCRWCHAKIHNGVARLDDDAGRDPEAIAERERRRSKELDELGFETARERYDDSHDG